jgi:TM2 domain-containing membrane protein YozV
MPGEKSAGVAVILSFLIAGLGQMYNGEITKGLLLLVLYIVLAVGGFFFCIPYLGVLVLWIYGMYDAYTRAEEYNRQLRATGRPPW